ncbi:MAG: NADH-quinone oxidoreductase subunit H [Ktedonobacteraceae bacterium]
MDAKIVQVLSILVSEDCCKRWRMWGNCCYKEDIQPKQSDKLLFLPAPAVFLAPIVAAFAVLPFSPCVGFPGTALATGIVVSLGSGAQAFMFAYSMVPGALHLAVVALMVNTLRSGQIWPANVEHCPQFWTLRQTFLEKLLLIWLLSSMFCK